MNPAALERVIRAEARRRLGAEVERIAVRPSGRRSTADLHEVDVTLADGDLGLILKRSRPVAPPSRPALVHDPCREARTYRHILGGAETGSPELWGAWATRDGGAALLVERIAGVTLTEARSLDAWSAAAGWAAGLHDRVTARGRRNARRAGLIVADARRHRLWMERARSFSDAPDVERLAGAHRAVVAGIGRLPRAFVHGELYPANVMIEDREGTPVVRPVDWETAGLGPGLMDLAALTGGEWEDPDARTAVALAYRDASSAWSGVADRAFLRALDLCAVQVAIGWLGWSDSWSPPPEHARNWLSAALAAIERLGL